MIDGVLLFHSTLQLIIAPSSEYSDQPKKGTDAQKSPLRHEIVTATINILLIFDFVLAGVFRIINLFKILYFILRNMQNISK